MSTRKSGPKRAISLDFRRPGGHLYVRTQAISAPTPGELRLTIRTLTQILVLAAPSVLLSAGNIGAQVVVPPGDTYVESSGPSQSGSMARWRIPATEPRVLLVYFEAPPEHRPEFWNEARNALRVWEDESGAPLSFQEADGPEESDVEFRWISRFSTVQAGSTHRQLDDSGFIEHVTVTLADTHSDGMRMSDEFVRLVALHEVGHVVGLPHSENPSDIMHPGNRNLELSGRDIRSVRILYGRPIDEAP